MSMGFSATTASAPPGWRASVRVRNSPMKRRSSRRSTNSPRIWQDMSTSIGFSNWHGKRERADRESLQQASDAIEAQSSPDVGRARLVTTIAHEAVIDSLIPIDARSGQLQTERTGHRRFRPTGIRRTVTSGVAAYSRDRGRCGRAWRDRRRQNEPQSGEAGGRQIDEIVEPRRRPAKGNVILAAMADHAIGSVDGLVEGSAAEPADQDPEQRRDDSIREILGEALDRRARDAGFVERLRIAPDDHRHGAPAARQPLALQRLRDGADMSIEAALRRQAGGDRGEDEKAEPAGGRRERHSNPHAANRQKQQSERERAGRATPRERQRWPVQARIEPGEPSPHPGDGMADRAVENSGISSKGLDNKRREGQWRRQGEMHRE